MNREQALEILKSLIKNENLIKHHLACEATMKALYKKLTPHNMQNPNEEQNWGIVGLLHDADYELSKDTPEKHTIILEEKLKDKIDPKLMYAIKSHNWKFNDVAPKSRLDWSIFCCDELTGLIIAAALISPGKKLAQLTPDFVMKRFNEPSFAKGSDRNQIKFCEKELSIPLNEFINLTLTAMQQIAPQLGL
nr:phosphohydrolase [Candidatus Levybacteria bacterium]